MRAVWIDEGATPDWPRLDRNGITWIYVSVRDPRARAILDDTLSRGFKGGVYAAWSWWDCSGPRFAEIVDEKLKAIYPLARATFPKVQLNDETHDPARIVGMLQRWRDLRPSTDTSWTMEGMQGGWMGPEFVQSVLASKVRLVPQAYLGQMEPLDTLAVARDLTARGFPDRIISPFYDAKNLPGEWSGWAFTQGRLP